MSQQQTVLRVQTNIPGSITDSYEYEFLDLYSSIPILINKSFAELGDIGKRNSDYSVGVLLPGSKKNNAFFENYFNVDTTSLYFNPNTRVPCWVLINDESYFTGYLRLNKVSVQDSKKEYDVTLYSTPAELYGNIGNNLLKDLNFSDDDYRFNHEFSLQNVTEGFNYQNMAIDGEKPKTYFYPIVHNGYLYTGSTVNFTGGTILSRTRLYTSTSNSAGQLDSYSTPAAAWADGVQEYRLNSPGQGPYDNQLKPGLSIWSLLQLMFKTYGYSIESDFFNSPWMKYLYLYGYFSSEATKFSWIIYNIQSLPLSGVEVFFVQISGDVYCVVSKLGTGIPCYCDSDINVTFHYSDEYNPDYTFDAVIPYGTSGLTIANIGLPFNYGTSPDVPNGTTLKYLPRAVGDYVNFVDGDFVDFSLVIDQNIKQIDLLSSIAKKFNLIIIPDPNNGNNIRIEPYEYYVGTGNVHNWSNLISYDKGFTVEPALNYIESQILFTEQDDNDEGNKLFKTTNNRIYGQNIFYGPTSFKSQEKKIDTIFGPELIRKWDSDSTNNINLPLGINYVGSNSQGYTDGNAYVNWQYTGVKTKPKIFWWLGSFNPFIDLVGETYDATNYWTTYEAYVSNTSGTTFTKFDRIPVISHTMPMGNPDSNKINNDSQCILFNSEYPTDDIGVQAFNTYTENDAFSTFYEGRVSNLYNPNTRVLTGYFNLNYADIKNLEPQDLIKVNEQYFVVSKIEGFNYTNRELTKVELIQFNNRPKTYTDRYFKYYYCDNPSEIYKFKTDFINPNLLDSNFGWSVYYDHQIGNIGSTESGFTSTFRYVQNFSTTVYTPYYIYEVSKDDYDASGILWDYDTLHTHIYNDQPYGPFQYSMPTFWLNSGSTVTGTNLFTDCDNFATARNTYGILTGSSTYFGISVTPTPTPTLTPTPTPEISSAMRGSLIVTYDEATFGGTSPYVLVYVNNNERQLTHTNNDYLYSTYLYDGDVVRIKLSTTSGFNSIDVTRRDFQTDSISGNYGISDTFITGTTGSSIGGYYDLIFTATTAALDYNFEYYIDTFTGLPPTPTPTPSPTPTPTPQTPDSKYVLAVRDALIVFSSNNNGMVFQTGTTLDNIYIRGLCISSQASNIYYTKYNDYIQKSTDFAINYSNVTSAGIKKWNSINCDSTGQFVLASAETDGCYVSNDNGSTWNLISNSTGGTSYYQTYVKPVSVYPMYAMAETVDYIKYIPNSGTTTFSNLTSLGQKIWREIKFSDNNQYSLVLGDIVSGATNYGTIYLSTDSGTTYNAISALGTSIIAGEIDMSSNGQYMIMSDNTNGIRISSNYGSTWGSYIQPVVSFAFYTDISISANGQYMYFTYSAVAPVGGVYYSYDYGVNWVKSTSAESLFNVGGFSAVVNNRNPNQLPEPFPTPTPSPSPTVSPTPTPTPTISPTPTPSPSPTVSPTPTPTSTPTPTPTASSTPTPTPTASSTPTPTPTPTPAAVTYEYIYDFANGFSVDRYKDIINNRLTFSTGTVNLSNIYDNADSIYRTNSTVSYDTIGTTIDVTRQIRRAAGGTGTITITTSEATLYINGSPVSTQYNSVPFTLTTTYRTDTLNFTGVTINPGDTVRVEWVDHT